jgi:Bacterial PH domain
MPALEMTSSDGRVMWVPLFVVFVTGIALMLAILGSRPPRFEASGEGLRILGGKFGRLIPAAQLRLDAARVVDLKSSPELRPKWRTMGISVPGYKGGWFRLQNGEKALVFLRKRSRAVFIPTTAGYSLLIVPDDPEAFLNALRTARR